MADLRRDVIYNVENVQRHRLPRVFNRYIHFEGISDEELRMRYRFGRDSIQFIAALIEDEVKPITKRNHAIFTEQQVLITLRFFASGSFLQVIGDTFGCDKGTVSRIVRRVSLALAAKHETFITFPTTNEEKQQVRSGMYELAGFPCIVGCVDGTHVRIQSPSNNEPNYVNRKGYHSVNVQIVCDDKG